jgi:NAD(P)-dependent dehydrogenase (short-subunit alcohol dehydrogenase family)
MSFAGKIAIVTGGASGIGRALCTQLIERGAHVTVADVDGDGATQVADELGHGAVPAAVDVRDAGAVEALVADTAGARGRIDYLFNNAGIAVIGPMVDNSADDWDRIIDINLRGVVHGVRAAYPRMIEQGGGHIVNTASVAGLIPSPGLVAYAATKHAVVGLSRSLRIEARAHGVNVSVVCPGFIKTNIVDNATVRGMDRDQADAPVPFWYPVDKCARDILRGVARNDGVIVVSGHGKQLYRLSRYAPRLLDAIGRFAMRRQQSKP